MGVRGAAAFITGGGRGIGRAIAHALAAEGARIAVAARTCAEIESVADEIRASGGEGLAVVCDVTSQASVDRALAHVVAQYGRIEILINNAGMVESAPLSKMDDGLWDRTLAVNLTGTYRCSKAVLPGMVTAGWGRIVNIASVASRIGGAYISAYAASKHGVLGFTRSIALEVAASGVTINAVCPGYADTPMTDASIARITQKTRRSEQEARAALEAMSPQRRLIQPTEVAAVAVFLCGDQARGITGQAINVDGGTVMS